MVTQRQSRKNQVPESPNLHDDINKDPFPSPEPQEQCILFRLPVEARWMIYEFVFTEVDVCRQIKNIGEEDLVDDSLESSTRIRKPKQAPYWLRPGCTTRTRIWTDLLQTCKLVYNEANPFPVKLKEHKCHNFQGPGQEPSEYFKRFTLRQLNQIRRLRIYTQQDALTTGEISLRQQLKMVAPTLEHLTLTIRNCTNHTEPRVLKEQLRVNPYRFDMAEKTSMLQDMQSMADGENLTMDKAGWPGTFALLQSLKTLTIEFEHHEGFEDELERLVQWAQKWRFPLQTGHVLVSSSAQQSSWRGLPVHDDTNCLRCKLARPSRARASLECQGCQWRKRGRGPRMITWRVKWVKTEGDPFEDMSVKPRPQKRPAVSSRELGGLGIRPGSRRAPPPGAGGTLHCRGGGRLPSGGPIAMLGNPPPEALRSLIEYGIL